MVKKNEKELPLDLALRPAGELRDLLRARGYWRRKLIRGAAAVGTAIAVPLFFGSCFALGLLMAIIAST